VLETLRRWGRIFQRGKGTKKQTDEKRDSERQEVGNKDASRHEETDRETDGGKERKR